MYLSELSILVSLEFVWLVVIFFCIAVVYSSAGLGGGSSYLAVLSFFSISFVDVRLIALLCNIVVVSSAVMLFQRHHLIPWRKLLPMILASIPLAFVGASLSISQRTFYILLGIALLIAALLLLIERKPTNHEITQSSNTIIGGSIGFLSGLVGIGGGIFLAPVLHLSRWDGAKKIAATTSVFILVNSLAGIIGHITSYGINLPLQSIIGLGVAVYIGSQIGTRATILKLNPLWVRRITSSIIFLVAVRLLFKYI